MYCKNCGHKLDDAVKFCGNCGYAFEDEVQVQSEINVSDKKKSKKGIYILCGIIILIAIVGADNQWQNIQLAGQ